EVAIDVNRKIMRAFVMLRHLVSLPDTSNRLYRMECEIQHIKEEMNETLADQNDINESTRAQLDAISTALAQLQADKPPMRPRRRIGFVQDD
ncbi:MAG: ORF6N domain-containing protein, partial [Prevotella sp.]|nr:ORF6N domain-containing protein [Prevotella sp.]